MAEKWWDKSWNPVTGCTPVSEGCRNCYAEQFHNRFNLEPKRSPDESSVDGYRYDPKPFSEVTLHPERLEIPLHWRKPRKIFLCSMGDLFHPKVPDEFVDQVFGTMSWCREHTYQLLTKRIDRAAIYCETMRSLSRQQRSLRVARACGFMVPYNTPGNMDWPLPNVWLVTSISNQDDADKNIPYLLQTPAAVRGVSIEPMLSPVEIDADWLWPRCRSCGRHFNRSSFPKCDFEDCGYESLNPRNLLDWVIVGGETGPVTRPMNPDWARDIRDQCRAAGVPLFVKQMSGRQPIPEDLMIRQFPGDRL